MPIVLNEPLSFLQRISEYMEHTYLINKACSLSDSIERMQVHTRTSTTTTTSTWGFVLNVLQIMDDDEQHLSDASFIFFV